MVTSPTEVTSPGTGPRPLGKRRAPSGGAQERSAWPNLKKGKPSIINMKRTPQPTLTQSKLTSMLQAAPQGDSAVAPAGNMLQQSGHLLMTTDQVEMDTSAPAQSAAHSAPSKPAHPEPTALTTDFLLKAMKQNTDEIIKSFNASIGALAGKIEENSVRISDNSLAI